jgi:hypothetical protein
VTAPSTWTLYPALGADGTSLVVYAEDGVTVIPAVTGASCPYAKFYQDLVNIDGTLRTTSPLATSGDPITIPPYLKVSGGQVGNTTSALTAVVIDGELRTTNGFYADGDGGGGTFRGKLTQTLVANGNTVINVGSTQWVLQISYGDRLNILQLGCKADNATSCGALINAYIAAESARLLALGTGGVVGLLIPKGGRFYSAQKILALGATGTTLDVRGEGYTVNINEPFGTASWLLSGSVSGSVIRFAQGIDGFGSDTGFYAALYLEGFAILGSGAGTGAGVHVYNPGNLSYTSRNIGIFNFYMAEYNRSGVTQHGHYGAKIRGCFYGRFCGGELVGDGPTDTEFTSDEIQSCNVGYYIERGYNLAARDFLVQGCAQAFQFGTTGDVGYGSIEFGKGHEESSGWYTFDNVIGQVTAFSRLNCVTVTTANDTLSGLAIRNGVTPVAGDRVLVAAQTNQNQNGSYIAAAGAWVRADSAATTHAGCVWRITGGTYASTFWQVDNTTPAWADRGDAIVITNITATQEYAMKFASSVTSNGLITWSKFGFATSGYIRPKNCVFMDSGGGPILVAEAGQIVRRRGIAGWTSITLDVNARWQCDEEIYPTRQIGQYSGTISHDWANQGNRITLQAVGNITLNAPTNAPFGARLTIQIQQDSTGGRTLSFGAGLADPGYSNVGNVAGTYIVRQYEQVNSGVWRLLSGGVWA